MLRINGKEYEFTKKRGCVIFITIRDVKSGSEGRKRI